MGEYSLVIQTEALLPTTAIVLTMAVTEGSGSARALRPKRGRPPKNPRLQPSLAQLPSSAIVPLLPVSRTVEMDNVHIVTTTQCTTTAQESTPQEHLAQDQSGRCDEVMPHRRRCRCLPRNRHLHLSSAMLGLGLWGRWHR